VLARVTGDLFVAPTRAPHELRVSMRLRDAGVPTPEVLAYAVYRGPAGLRRADVVTREIAGAADLLATLSADPSAAHRSTVWDAVRTLVEGLSRAGAVHADLNVRNVLIAREADARPVAYALDVDRVVWRKPGDPSVARANWARLERSARKRGLR